MLVETERLAKIISTLRSAAEQLEALKDNDRDAKDQTPDKHPGDKHRDEIHPDKPRGLAAKVIDEYFEGRYQQYGEYEDFGELIVEKADDAGLQLALACALVDHESGGRNIFGCDEGGPFCNLPVTRSRVEHIVDGGKFRHGMQGIGLTQITWWEFVLRAEKLGGAHIPANQLQVGFSLMADYVKTYPFKEALGAYNAGPSRRTSADAEQYAETVADKHEAWKERLKNVGKPEHHGQEEPDNRGDSVYQVRIGAFDTKAAAERFTGFVDGELKDQKVRASVVVLKERGGSGRPDSRPGDASDRDPDKRHDQPDWLIEPIEYIRKTAGGPYIPWERGRFFDGAPAWVDDDPPPKPEVIAREGAFCAAVPTLMMRYNRIWNHDLLDGPRWDPAWFGGVLWYGEYFLDKEKVGERFKGGVNWPVGSLFIKRYTGRDLANQGHVWVKIGPEKMFQYDKQFGGNSRRNLRDTVALAGGCDGVVRPENWLKP